MHVYRDEHHGNGSPVNKHGQEIIRRFDPACSYMHCDVPKRQLVTYNAFKGISQLQTISSRTGTVVKDSSTAVIHIDGACRGNGTHFAQGAWGVYFGPQSPFNWCGLLPWNAPQTSSCGEIMALIRALDIIEDELATDFSLRRIIIVSDSLYLVRAMSEWMDTWIDNRGRKTDGQRVAHWGAWKSIRHRIDDMTYGENGGLEFKFWHVARDSNRDADELARSAFEM
ncbi:hypothetical protein F66182_8558 [Fusarium sp. NRRL 66182]|nr:hypothetical protein F66182_8558 [Fusarium sp. NRRL 66182]